MPGAAAVTVQGDAAVAGSAGMNGCVRLVQSRHEHEGWRGDSIARQDTARRRIRTPDGGLLRRILSVRRYSNALSAGMAPGQRPRCPGDRHRAGGADAHSHRRGSARHPADRSPWRGADRARRRGDARRGRICRDGICRWLHRHPRRLCRDLGRVRAGHAARRFLRTARAQGARRGLRAGAAVGIGGVHPRQHGRWRLAEPVGRRPSRLGAGRDDGGDGGGDVAAAALARRRRGGAAQAGFRRAVALGRVRRGDRRREPHPGEPRRAVRLRDPAMDA